MSDGPSLLSFLAAGLYVLVAGTCVVAFVGARNTQRPDWHALGWAALALLFALLFAMRLTGIEETLRESARGLLRAGGAFESRRELQRPLLATLIVLCSAMGFWLGFKAIRGSRRRLDVIVKSAIGAGLAMGILLALRVISLHAVDQILYGSLKLNWFADVGTSLLVLGAAAYYTWLTRPLRGAPRR